MNGVERLFEREWHTAHFNPSVHIFCSQPISHLQQERSLPSAYGVRESESEHGMACRARERPPPLAYAALRMIPQCKQIPNLRIPTRTHHRTAPHRRNSSISTRTPLPDATFRSFAHEQYHRAADVNALHPLIEEPRDDAPSTPSRGLHHSNHDDQDEITSRNTDCFPLTAVHGSDVHGPDAIAAGAYWDERRGTERAEEAERKTER